MVTCVVQFHVKRCRKKNFDPARIRTWNLLIRSQTRYPLRHRAARVTPYLAVNSPCSQYLLSIGRNVTVLTNCEMCNIAQGFRGLHTILRALRTRSRQIYYDHATGSLDAVVRRPRGVYGVFSKSARCSNNDTRSITTTTFHDNIYL